MADPLKGHGKFRPGKWPGDPNIDYCNRCSYAKDYVIKTGQKCTSKKKRPITDNQRINFLAGCVNGISIGQFVFEGKRQDFWCGGSRDKRSLRRAIDKAIDEKNANRLRNKK